MSTDFQHFGKYELHKRMNRNASGEIWKGYDPELQHTVAIKVYYINQHVDSDFIAHFANRMAILTSLHHPNIVPIQDFYIVPSKNPGEATASMACIITDYIEAQTLADYIRAHPGSANFLQVPKSCISLPRSAWQLTMDIRTELFMGTSNHPTFCSTNAPPHIVRSVNLYFPTLSGPVCCATAMAPICLCILHRSR